MLKPDKFDIQYKTYQFNVMGWFDLNEFLLYVFVTLEMHMIKQEQLQMLNLTYLPLNKNKNKE
jgi:hypothetical protein